MPLRWWVEDNGVYVAFGNFDHEIIPDHLEFRRCRDNDAEQARHDALKRLCIGRYEVRASCVTIGYTHTIEAAKEIAEDIERASLEDPWVFPET